ncbi:MAG: cysteine protease [Ferruginibacter sp.]|nr:cysteine protease [Ferruginibacter sp.]
MNSVNRLSWFITFTCVCCILFTVSQAQGGQRFFTGDNTDENEFNKISKSAQRATRDLSDLPSSASIKEYAPVPGHQGEHGTCVAWSTCYAARTISYCIQHQITDTAKIRAAAFSPDYLYYYIKKPGDDNCLLGAKIEPALKILSDKGDVLLSENISNCIGKVDVSTDNKAGDYIIKAYTSLTNVFGGITKNEVIAIKKSLVEKKPIVFSVKCFKSLFDVGKDGAWKITPNDQMISNHAICIVGYDDNMMGGAFEVMNSWGTAWGNNGFFWITYDQIRQYGSYALEMMDREVYAARELRGMEPPQIRGSLDFILVNDFGNDVGPMPVIRSAIDASSSAVENDNKADFSYYRLLENYPAWQFFKIKFTTNAPAFVYIISIDDKQEVSTLFPYAANISPAVNSTNATIYLPSEEKHYKLDANANRDRICILYSKTAIDFDALKSKIAGAPSTIYETIQSMYRQRLIPVKRIVFKENAVSFSAMAAEQEMVCVFVDLNRK